MIKTIELDGLALTYTLERKAVKHINLRLYPNGAVYVSAAPRVPDDRIDAFLLDHRAAIQRALAKYAARAQQQPPAFACEEGDRLPIGGRAVTLRWQAGTPASVILRDDTLRLTLPDPADQTQRHRLLTRWAHRQCEERLRPLLREAHARVAPFDVPFPEITWRAMTSRWGSCRPAAGRITLNVALICLPPACAEYVMVHELAHCLRADHSARFYQWMDRLLPDWPLRKQQLRTYEPYLTAFCSPREK